MIDPTPKVILRIAIIILVSALVLALVSADIKKIILAFYQYQPIRKGGKYWPLSVSADMKKRLSVYPWGTQMYVLPRNNMVTIWNRKCFYCLIPLYDPLLFLIYLSPNYDTFRWFVRPQLVGLASPRYWDVDKDFGSGTKRSKSTREDI